MTKASLTGRHLPNFLLALTQALRELRESDQHGIVEEGSWQEKMVRTYWCGWITNVTAVSGAIHISQSLHGILFVSSQVAQCRSRLAVRPDSARAVLFYSQYVMLSIDSSACDYIFLGRNIYDNADSWFWFDFFLYRLPNGKPDPKSKHGGCPVLSGVKVSANEQRATQSITDCTITFVDSCYPQHSYNGFFLVSIVFLFR